MREWFVWMDRLGVGVGVVCIKVDESVVNVLIVG